MRITVLAGGVGGSRFLLGLRSLGHDITVVVNNGDDITLFGLRVCPDLDTVMYTLGGGISAERGWGREDETFRVRDELAAYGAEPTWFGLGDLDLATHVLRTQWLRAGLPLSEITRRMCRRWQPGVRLLPVTDEPVETHVTLTDGRVVHFQEWWVRMHAAEPATRIELTGVAGARPAPGVLEAIRDTDVVVLPPSNPVVSIGTILAVPGVRDAVARTTAPVVGPSPRARAGGRRAPAAPPPGGRGGWGASRDPGGARGRGGGRPPPRGRGGGPPRPPPPPATTVGAPTACSTGGSSTRPTRTPPTG